MSDAAALRKIANDLRTEAIRRDSAQKVQTMRVVVATIGLEVLRKLAGGRP